MACGSVDDAMFLMGGRGGRGGGGRILSIMTRMNEKAEMSIISADLALERSISVREIRQWLAVMMQGRVAASSPY